MRRVEGILNEFEAVPFFIPVTDKRPVRFDGCYFIWGDRNIRSLPFEGWID